MKRTTATAKPCEVACPKCGSADVARSFNAKGETVRSYVYGKQPNQFMSGLGTYNWTTTRDHIHNNCRSCHYEWATMPLAANNRKKSR